MTFNTWQFSKVRLKEDEAKELIRRAQSGDAEAKEQMVHHNLRLVASLVNRFSASDIEKEDLFQVGCMGLIKSIERFDLEQPVAFSTYAVPVILGEIKQYLRRNTFVKVGRTLHELAVKALKARDELSRALEREPTLAEVAAALDADPADIVDALDALKPVSSMYEQVHTADDSAFLVDVIHGQEGEEISENIIEAMAVTGALESLSPREKTIVELRYRFGLTQSKIAQRLGISQVHVFRIEKAALAKIRESVEAE